MRSFVTWLGEALLGRKGKPPAPRLSEAEAIEIASAYAKGGKLHQSNVTLVPQDVRDIGGKLVWTLRTPTVGNWVMVEVDDATGEVVGHHVHGVRGARSSYQTARQSLLDRLYEQVVAMFYSGDIPYRLRSAAVACEVAFRISRTIRHDPPSG